MTRAFPTSRDSELIGNTLRIAIQRQCKDDPEYTVKLVAYNLDTKEWGAVRYPTDVAERGWVGLAEITLHGDHVYIIERDNLIGDAARIKKQIGRASCRERVCQYV